MTTEDYISFETAKLLMEKGFDAKCRAYYISDDEIALLSIARDFNNNGIFLSAPTLQMVMKWLREKGWFICIIPLAFYCGEKASKFGYNIWAGDNLEVDEFNTPKFNTYEEACEDAIKYCLKNLI